MCVCVCFAYLALYLTSLVIRYDVSVADMRNC